MANESSSEEQGQKVEREDPEARLERQNKEKDEARKARQVRLGHVEKPKRRSAKKNGEEESEKESE